MRFAIGAPVERWFEFESAGGTCRVKIRAPRGEDLARHAQKSLTNDRARDAFLRWLAREVFIGIEDAYDANGNPLDGTDPTVREELLRASLPLAEFVLDKARDGSAVLAEGNGDGERG